MQHFCNKMSKKTFVVYFVELAAVLYCGFTYTVGGCVLNMHLLTF